MKFQIKSNQGTVSGCEHILAMKEDFNKKNLGLSLKHLKICVKCLKHLNAVTEKYSNSSLASESPPLKYQPTLDNDQLISPLVSISVVDTDNLNICMCSLKEDHNNDEMFENHKICKICRLNIKKQKNERCMLISKRTMLGDVVVNRIDSQYLTSNYSSSLSQMKKLQDPYTPESIESHSPQPELEDKDFPLINETVEIFKILENVHEVNNYKKPNLVQQTSTESEKNRNDDTIVKLHNQYNVTHTVSPSQLTTRLEILRRESQLMIHDVGSKNAVDSEANIDDDKSLKKLKCCLRCCVIL